MVSRLEEYKSYIPAAVFEKLAREKEAEAGSHDGHESDRSGTTTTVSCHQQSSQVSQEGTANSPLCGLCGRWTLF